MKTHRRSFLRLALGAALALPAVRAGAQATGIAECLAGATTKEEQNECRWRGRGAGNR